jgi:hypothetical protein
MIATINTTVTPETAGGEDTGRGTPGVKDEGVDDIMEGLEEGPVKDLLNAPLDDYKPTEEGF